MIGPVSMALLFLAIGLAEVALASRSAYPALRWRFEKAKATQSQGVSPSTIMALVKFQGLVLMPAAGFLLGGRMASISG